MRDLDKMMLDLINTAIKKDCYIQILKGYKSYKYVLIPNVKFKKGGSL
jgi:hypothetical protein